MSSPAEHEPGAADSSRSETQAEKARRIAEFVPGAGHLDEPALHAYLDGELPDSEHLVAERHLATCPDCSARVTALQTLFTSLEALPDTPLPRDLAGSVVAALRHEAAIRPVLDRRRLWWLAPQAIAAALLLAFALPSLGNTWLTDASELFDSSKILRDSGIGGLAFESALAMNGLADGITQFAAASWDGLAGLDSVIGLAWTPYAGWSALTWTALLLALLPLWWLANRWLLRVELPRPMSARERRPA